LADGLRAVRTDSKYGSTEASLFENLMSKTDEAFYFRHTAKKLEVIQKNVLSVDKETAILNFYYNLNQ